MSCLLIAFIHIIPINYLLLIYCGLSSAIISILFIQLIITNMKINLNDIIITFFGIFYIIGFIVYIPLIYGMEAGKYLIWYLLFVAWGTDTFGYFIGVKFGKHKLTKISPKKSIEGSIAGIIGAILITTIYTFLLNKYTTIDISYINIILITLILSILSQMGDLVASSIKRYTEIKDFGKLIPGHRWNIRQNR